VEIPVAVAIAPAVAAIAPPFMRIPPIPAVPPPARASYMPVPGPDPLRNAQEITGPGVIAAAAARSVARAR
jgi:hypothetical protein